MTARRRHPHLVGASIRIAVVLIAGLIVVPAVIVDGDVLVLPAVALVVLAWMAIAIVAALHWVLTVGGPPLVTTTTIAARAAWRAIADDPIGAPLHSGAARVRRSTDVLRRPGRWARNRVSLAPTGLPLTLAALIVASGVIGLVRLGSQVDRRRSSLSRFDLRVAEAASRLGVSGERRVMEALTNIGATRSVILVAVVLVVGALAERRRRSAVLLVATLVLSSGLVTILKVRHARPRPALGQLVERSTSFPSGHAAGSLSLALGIVLWWWAAGRRRTAWVAALVVPLALLIGFSRAYLSIHWLSDVFAGWLCASLAAAVTFGADCVITRALEPDVRRGAKPMRVAGVLAACAVGVLAVTGAHQLPIRVPSRAPARLSSAGPAALLAPLPQFSETLLGRRMEPLGLVVVAREAQLRAAIDRAGWSVADILTPGRLLETYRAGITNARDATAPVTPTFLDTRLEDLAIQRQSLGNGVKARHHARLWRLPIVTPGGCPVWAVTASLDDRVEWTVKTLLPNHHIAPAIDTEREYLAAALAGTGELADTGRFDFVGPTLGTNAAGDPFFTDGKVAVLRQPGCG